MSDRKRRISDPDGGYTLVEMLVVLGLVAVLSTTMLMAISQFKSLLRLESQIESRLALQRTARHIADLLEQTEDIAVLTPGEGETLRHALQGSANEVRFIATARRGAYVQGLREIKLRLDSEGDAGRLIQEMVPRRTGAVSGEGGQQIELGRDIAELAFAYFGVQNGTIEPDWQSVWTDLKTLPFAISVRITARRAGALITVEDVASLGVR